ncbi:hypothetical protein NRB20_71490 [Nocardia sp. RB20]|uniref:Uncharacterized protein n=1 Tax=Nocardia macrotermitis TaxID=2585198 RepID=A0A7K0DDY5_9NOCA|nr:hypothetical protein [Nocardia macrotermitis]
MTLEPSAIVAINPSLCGGRQHLYERALYRLAVRLGYLVLASRIHRNSDTVCRYEERVL